jgi:hypothetical protein
MRAVILNTSNLCKSDSLKTMTRELAEYLSGNVRKRVFVGEQKIEIFSFKMAVT